MGDMLLRQGDQLDEARIVVIERTLLLRHVLLRARRNSFPSIEQPVPYRVRNGSGLPEQPPWQGFRYCYLVHIGKNCLPERLRLRFSARFWNFGGAIFFEECGAPSLPAPWKFFCGKMGPLFSAGGARKFFFGDFWCVVGPPEVLLVFPTGRHFPASGGGSEWAAQPIGRLLRYRSMASLAAQAISASTRGA